MKAGTPEKVVRAILRDYQDGRKVASIARRYMVTRQHVYSLVHKHLGGLRKPIDYDYEEGKQDGRKRKERNS